MEPLLGVTKDDKRKPRLSKVIDFTKGVGGGGGGTDIIDQKMGSYTTKSKTRKWPKVAFAYLVDTIRVDASTVYALANKMDPKKVSSFGFGREVGRCAYQAICIYTIYIWLSQNRFNKKSNFLLGKRREHVTGNQMKYEKLF